MKAIRVHEVGDPEVMQLEDLPDPRPGGGEVLVRIEKIGVNFIDIYHRTGLYPLELPFTPGREAAGVVEALGEGVTGLKASDRVAYAMTPGAYAEASVVPAWKLVPLPQSVSAADGAAAMLQGLTAHYLAHSTFPLASGHRALVHAAAGGVGLLLIQIAKRAGALVMGTVSTKEKADAASQAGADIVVRYTEEDFQERVNEWTSGRGLDVVYDSVGKTTFEKSLRCLRPRGMLVLYGQSSGPVPPFDAALLARGSHFLTRPSLAHYMLDREELLKRAGDVFEWIADGELKLTIDRELPLVDAPEAHRLLASRATSGKLLLAP
jgi:NADPH2:quinone reductase